MPLKYLPEKGEIVICDFTKFGAPEITKVRPAIVISSPMKNVANVCTVVALSTTPPRPPMPFHALITIDPPLRKPFEAQQVWVKGDMIYTLSVSRLNRPDFKGSDGIRRYYQQKLDQSEYEKVEKCIRQWLKLF